LRTLVGSVGYFNLSDLSAALLVVDELKREPPVAAVDFVDLSYGGPIATVHRLRESEPPYDRLVLVGAVETGKRIAGYRWYSWPGALPPASEVQARIAEAVTGVIDLASYPIIAQQFESLPEDVRIVEIEPVRTDAGLEPSPEIKRLLPDLCRLVRRLAEEP
jgi:hypothetical protein